MDLHPPHTRRKPPTPDRVHGPLVASRIWFLVTFLGAWAALVHLVTSPPVWTSATSALVVAASIVATSQRRAEQQSWRATFVRLGLGRPTDHGLLESLVVGTAVVVTFLGGSAALGIDLELRSNWPSVLVGIVVFHGLAEELVWRGYAYGRARRTTTYGRAVLLTMPLIALTHVPIIAGNGVGIGFLAVVSASVTCLPFARLYDRGGATVWPPAVLHASIGTWQLFERSYPTSFSILILCGSILTPLAAFAFRRPSGPPQPSADRPPTTNPTRKDNP